MLCCLRYDNNANPGAADAVTHTIAWNTTFDSVGLRVESGNGWQRGHAFTLAYIFQPSAHWRYTHEWLRIVGASYNRAEFTDGPPTASQTQVQLAIRYALGSSAN